MVNIEEWEQEVYAADRWLTMAGEPAVEMDDLLRNLTFAVMGLGHAQLASVLWHQHMGL